MTITDELHELFKTTGVLCATDVAILMRDRYETKYGIFNHADPTAGPLALVKMHWCEDSSTDSVLYERIQLFAERFVHKHFGLSLTDWLALPSDIANQVLEISTKQQKQENNITSNLMNNLSSG